MAVHVVVGSAGAGAATARLLAESGEQVRLVSRSGRVRARLWRDAKAAYDAGRARVTEVRASDFIGPDATSVVTQVLIPKVRAGKPASIPADLDAPHSWTIITDAARALIAASRHEESWGRAWHVPTNPPLSVRELAERYAASTGSPEPRLRPMPGWMLRVAGVFSPLIRELPEVQYQFRRPFVLDSSLTEKTFGLSPAPLETAWT